jgi:DNA repair ATPase RecN
MPNIWSSATQNINEAFQGPRTKDIHLNAKFEEVKRLEIGINTVKSTLEKIKKNSEGMKNIFKDLSDSLQYFYDKNSNSKYYKILNSIVDANENLIKINNKFNSNINQIISKTSEWGKICGKFKVSYNEREEKRKVYDHYDEKMEKFVITRSDKLKKKLPESKKEIELYERVIKNNFHLFSFIFIFFLF